MKYEVFVICWPLTLFPNINGRPMMGWVMAKKAPTPKEMAKATMFNSKDALSVSPTDILCYEPGAYYMLRIRDQL